MPHLSFSPKIAIITTVLLAVLSIGGAALLVRSPKETFNPTKTSAATTSTITDNFNGTSVDNAKWTFSSDSSSATATVGNGVLTINHPSIGSSSYATLDYKNTITGDFIAEAEFTSLASNLDQGVQGISITNGSNYFRVVRYNDGRLVTLTQTPESPSPQTSGNLNAGLGSVKVKIQRVGSIGQAFYDKGQGYTLLGSFTSAYPGGGTLKLFTLSTQQFPNVIATFDNFSAQVNLASTSCGGIANLQCPTGFICQIDTSNGPIDAGGICVPGLTNNPVIDCKLSFNVLNTVPTPTPGPSSTPTPTPTPTSTPTPSPTPTPSGTPNSCNGTCGSNANCSGGMVCDLTSGRCRNPSCLANSNCICAGNPTPTPTPKTVVSGPTPTPVTILEEAGTTSGTWAITITGAALLLLGAMVAFAL